MSGVNTPQNLSAYNDLALGDQRLRFPEYDKNWFTVEIETFNMWRHTHFSDIHKRCFQTTYLSPLFESKNVHGSTIGQNV